MRSAVISMRTGGVWITAVGDSDDAASIGRRMVSGGFIVCRDSRWGKEREIVINLADVKSVLIESAPVDGQAA